MVLNKKKGILGVVLVMFLGCACTPQPVTLISTIPPEDLAETRLVETVSAFTQTSTMSPSFTMTQTPTTTPTQTPSPTPSRTSTPSITATRVETIPYQPDPDAMLDWKSVGFPAAFTAMAPDDYGIGKGAGAFSMMGEDGSIRSYTIENGFVFVDEARFELIFGYTVSLPTASEQVFYDFFIMNLPTPGQVVDLSDKQQLEIDRIGGSSIGVTGIAAPGRRLDIILFRVGEVGAWVFIRYPDGASPSIPVNDLAKVYAQSIGYPTSRCFLSAITPVEGAAWPSFDFIAEGFYPGERRSITLSGEAQIGSETLPLVHALLGQNGEAASSEGRIEGNVVLPEVAGEDVVLSSEFSLSIQGWYSKCEVSQRVSWPSE